MNAKHTQGPWELHGRAVYTADKRKHWVKNRDARQTYIAQVRARHDSEIGSRVDDVEDNPVSEQEAEANARLISAAPELLEALSRLLLTVEDIGSHGPGETRDELIEMMHKDNSGLLRSARVALAKAKGQL